jgi:hypothetical protein
MSHPQSSELFGAAAPRTASGLDMIFGAGMVNGALSRKVRKTTG